MKTTNDCRVITIAINKGGTGKTTTSLTFAVLLASKGFKVLVIDNDPQRNASGFSGVEVGEETLALEDVYVEANESMKNISDPVDKEYVLEAIQKTENGYDIIPTTPVLASIENRYSNASNLYALKRVTKALSSEYDFIIIDNPPAVNTLAGNGVVAADDVIIPIEPSGSVEMTIINNMEFFNTLIEATQQDIHLDRILITRLEANDKEALEQIQQLESIADEVYECKVAKPYIRANRALKKSFNLNYSIVENMKDLKPTALFDYVKIVEEYLDDHGIKHKTFVDSVMKDGIIKYRYNIPFISKKEA